jgi:rhodanese-related sulfurtransferase
MPKTVRDIIKDRKEVYCISNQTTAAEAARFLKDRGIRATGVCNLSGKIVAWFRKVIYPTRSSPRTFARLR